MKMYNQEEYLKAKRNDLLECKCDYCGSIYKHTKRKIQVRISESETSKEYCSKQCFYNNRKTGHTAKCLTCDNVIYVKTSQNNCFCSCSCSAIHNNKNREDMSDSQKIKISETLKKRWKGLKQSGEIYNSIKKINICIVSCGFCDHLFVTSYNKGNYGHRYCSKECRTKKLLHRKYLNGSRKDYVYYNIHENKNVYLNSSWELKTANLLDSKKIKWIRPEPIQWIDNDSISHLYFPDFYLVDYNVYLDPKNPYVMKRDENKLKYLKSKNLPLIVGDINYMEEYINNLIAM